MPVVMGTAGHIDHGKTSLVRALTGIDCDRLEEERRRGITIELGFAFMDLAGSGPSESSGRLSIVDVPGHERFVRNMVSGAAGIDFVMLVIAADEGVMPQTREHLEICSLLGIRTGLVALTKTDMVDEEWLDLAMEDVKSFLAGTFLDGAPIIPVSSQTGQGMDILKAELTRMEKELRPKKRSDLLRLPIDRVFTMRGHGTVVTGTMISGQAAIGEDVLLYPSGKGSKVRGLQSHGETVSLAPAGRRTAVNLPGLEVTDIEKGEVLAHPGSLFPSLRWDVELTCLSSAPRPLRHRTEVHFHHGSRETLARLYFFDRDRLNPGESAFCQVRFAEPMVGVLGDRCVIRAYSPLRTVAGGQVLNPIGLDLRRRDPEFNNKLQKLLGLPKLDPAQLICSRLDLAEETGASFAELCVLSNLDSRQLDKELSLLGSKQELFCFDREDKRYIGKTQVQRLENSALEFVAAFHKKEPAKPGVGKGELASSWGRSKQRQLPAKLVHFIIERLVKKTLLTSEGEFLRIPNHKASLGANQQDIRQSILKVHAENGNTPPNIKDVLESLALSAKEAAPILKSMQDAGELVKVAEGLYYHGPALEIIRQGVRDWFKEHDDLNLAGLKEITGLSRKFLIALIEYFDKEKLTVRVGDKRILRGGQ